VDATTLEVGDRDRLTDRGSGSYAITICRAVEVPRTDKRLVLLFAALVALVAVPAPVAAEETRTGGNVVVEDGARPGSVSCWPDSSDSSRYSAVSPSSVLLLGLGALALGGRSQYLRRRAGRESGAGIDSGPMT
jgi:hypothetical protein